MNFEEFYKKFYARAYAYTMRKIQNSQDAEDLVCNVFLYCYDHFSEYSESKASIGTWLYLILNSRIKNHYRDKKQYVALEAIDEFLGSYDNDLAKAVELEEMRTALAKALEALSEIQRQIVIYRYFQDCTTAEMARRVGLTEGNVRTQLSRALAKMKKNIDLQEWRG